MAKDRIEELEGLLWCAWREMNAIRARSGVPLDFDGRKQGISEEYWSDLVDKMANALGGDPPPWATPQAKAIFDKADG